MISIPGQSGSTCDGFSRREFLRIGGMGMAGITLADILRLQASASTAPGAASITFWSRGPASAARLVLRRTRARPTLAGMLAASAAMAAR